MGSLVQLIHQTSWSEQPVRLQELQFCAQARRICTFFYVHLNASHDEPKSFSSNLITNQVKARFAVGLLITLQGIICCLTFFWAEEASWGTSERETSPGEPCWGRSQGSSRTLEEKAIHKRRLCLPTPGCSWGLHSQWQGQTEVTHWGDSEVACDGTRLLTVSALLTRVIMDDQLRGATAVGIPPCWWELWGYLWGQEAFTSISPWHTPSCLLQSSTGTYSAWLSRPCGLSLQVLCGQSSHWSTADKQREVWELTPACERASRHVGSSHISGHLRMASTPPAW